MRIIPTKMIYLDYAAATPLDANVGHLMVSLSKTLYANPSALHRDALAARKALDLARETIALCMHVHPDEILFTGSGTESNALALQGVVHNYRSLMMNEKRNTMLPHIVTTTIEHPAVLEMCRILERNNEVEVTYVSCNTNGLIDPKEIKKALRENTVLVSVMYANNEIGTVQPIEEIAKELRHFRKARNSSARQDLAEVYPLFHTDACQAINYLPIENLEKLGVDLLSCNSSKIYGPKGVGILYKKRNVTLAPLYAGGGQEQGLRPGTENTVSICATALAFEQTMKIKDKESARLTKLRDYGIDKLLALSEMSGYEIQLNGDREKRLPNNINISISGISSELLVIELDARTIAVSAKSACKADDPDESHVITALRTAQGKTRTATDGSLRISLGRGTTKSDIDALVRGLKDIFGVYKEWK